MKKYISIISLALLVVTIGCSKTDDEFLDIPPTSIIPADVAFTDPALVLAILGDLYNRLVDFSALDGFPERMTLKPVGELLLILAKAFLQKTEVISLYKEQAGVIMNGRWTGTEVTSTLKT